MPKISKAKSLEDFLSSVGKEEGLVYHKTGLLPFDLMNRGRGIAEGLIYQIYADTGFGKSTFILSLIQTLAERGKKSLFIEIEPNRALAKDMGLFEEPYVSHFAMYPLRTFAELGELTESFLQSDWDYMFIDSISACRPSSIDFATIETQMIGLDARIAQNYISLLQGSLQRSNKTVIYLNQIRSILNQKNPFGPTTTVDGGYASRFYAGVRTTILSNFQSLDPVDDKSVIGKTGFLFCEKNRTAAPLVQVPIQILFGKGVSNVYSLLYFLQWTGAMKFSGAGNVSFEIPGLPPENVRGKVERNNYVKKNYAVCEKYFYEKIEEYFDYLLTRPKFIPL